jgi:CBS domain containing-hemolysin-like protein
MVALGIAVAVLLLAGNAFFVAAEFALVSARHAKVEPLAAAGGRRAVVTLRAMENLSLMMAGAQLGVTVCSVALGAVGEPAVARALAWPFDAVGVPQGLLQPVAFALALVIVVGLHVVLGELVPKGIALAGPERAALVLAPPLVRVVRLLRPVVVGLNAIASLALRLIGIQQQDEVASAFTQDEVGGFVDEASESGLLDDDERRQVVGALSFDERTVAHLLIARDQIVTVPASATPADVEDVAATTGFSRLPTTDADGNLIGYLHLKDVLEDDERARRSPVPTERRRPLLRLDASAPLSQALGLMQETGSHIARVHDEDGAALGIVVLEDIVQELIGEWRTEPRAGTSITDDTAPSNDTPGTRQPDSPNKRHDLSFEEFSVGSPG